MAAENLKIKFTNTGKKENLDLPQFSITYKTAGKGDVNGSYEILSRLKKENDLIVEIKSTLNFGSDAENEKLTANCFDEIKKMDLLYHHKKVQAPARATILSILTARNKTVDAHEIWAYIPDSVWKEEGLRNIVSAYAARYYIAKKVENPQEFLNTMEQMSDDEKRKHFEMVVFNAPVFCQMGIASCNLTESDLKGLLGI